MTLEIQKESGKYSQKLKQLYKMLVVEPMSMKFPRNNMQKRIIKLDKLKTEVQRQQEDA